MNYFFQYVVHKKKKNIKNWYTVAFSIHLWYF